MEYYYLRHAVASYITPLHDCHVIDVGKHRYRYRQASVPVLASIGTGIGKYRAFSVVRQKIPADTFIYNM